MRADRSRLLLSQPSDGVLYESCPGPARPSAAAALSDDCDHDDCSADSTAEKAASGDERSVSPALAPFAAPPLSRFDSCWKFRRLCRF